MSNSHGLLVGLGGSGRASLTTLICFIKEIKLFTIEFTKSYNKESWIEDIKKIIITAGVDYYESVFMLNGT